MTVSASVPLGFDYPWLRLHVIQDKEYSVKAMTVVR
jgi:hypothetical protein